MDLSIRNVRGIYRADFSPFPKGEMGTGFGLPLLFQYRSPPCCRTRKQVAFKVLNTLLPPYPVTALFPVEEHLPIGKYFIRWPKAITSGLFPFQPLCFAALEPRFMPFLACHNKSIRPSYKYLVGCRLNCFALTHEMGYGTITHHARSVRVRASKGSFRDLHPRKRNSFYIGRLSPEKPFAFCYYI